MLKVHILPHTSKWNYPCKTIFTVFNHCLTNNGITCFQFIHQLLKHELVKHLSKQFTRAGTWPYEISRVSTSWSVLYRVVLLTRYRYPQWMKWIEWYVYYRCSPRDVFLIYVDVCVGNVRHYSDVFVLVAVELLEGVTGHTWCPSVEGLARKSSV